MTVEKAIRNLSFWESLFKDYHDKQLRDSLHLGIEALKALKAGREGRKYEFYAPLPGETEED